MRLALLFLILQCLAWSTLAAQEPVRNEETSPKSNASAQSSATAATPKRRRRRNRRRKRNKGNTVNTPEAAAEEPIYTAEKAAAEEPPLKPPKILKQPRKQLLSAIESGNIADVQFWLNEAKVNGIDHVKIINTPNLGDPMPPLCLAVRKGNEQIVGLLLNAGADPNVPEFRHKNTSLHFATALGNEKIIKLLLDAGAIPVAASLKGTTPIDIAKKMKDPNFTRLLRTGDWFQHSDKELNLFERAVYGGDEAYVREYFEADKDKSVLGYRNENGTLLMHSRNVAITKLLLDNGANINDSDKRTGGTALLEALEHKSYEVAKLLIDRLNPGDISFNQASLINGRLTTPLMVAAQDNKKIFVEELLEKGASFCMKNAKEAHVAHRNTMPEIRSVLESVHPDLGSFAEKLIGLGVYGVGDLADIKQGDLEEMQVPRIPTQQFMRWIGEGGPARYQEEEAFGIDALSLSIRNRSTESAVFLVGKMKKSAIKSQSSRGGKKHFFMASAMCEDEVVKAFLAKGVDIDAKMEPNHEYGGDTALFFAVRNNCLSTSRLLLESGADVHVKNNGIGLMFLQRSIKMLELLVEYGLKVDEKSIEGMTPLFHVAIKDDNKSYVAVMQFLLEKGADPNTRNKDGQTVLQWCVMNRNENKNDAIKVLLEHGANPNILDINGQTPLMWCLRNSRFNEAQLLLDTAGKAVANFPDKDGLTPLMWCVKNNLYSAVEMFLRHETTNLYFKNEKDQGKIAIHYAKNEKMRKLLRDGSISPFARARLRAGGWGCLNCTMVNEASYQRCKVCNVARGQKVKPQPRQVIPTWMQFIRILESATAQDVKHILKNLDEKTRSIWMGVHPDTQSTAFMHALHNENIDIEIFKVLLENGAQKSINFQDSNGFNSLMYAVRRNNMQLVRLFVEDGNANIHGKNKEGNTVFEYTKSQEIYDFLIHHLQKEFHSAIGTHGNEPLTVGFKVNLRRRVTQILEGVNEDTRTLLLNGRGQETSLMTVLMNRRSLKDATVFEMVKILVQYGAGKTLAAQNDEKSTALLIAVSDDDYKVVKFLLDNGAKATVNITNVKGWSPLTSAILRNNQDIVKVLLEAGANPYLPVDEGMNAIDYVESLGNVMMKTMIMDLVLDDVKKADFESKLSVLEGIEQSPSDLYSEIRPFVKIDDNGRVLKNGTIKLEVAKFYLEKCARLQENIEVGCKKLEMLRLHKFTDQNAEAIAAIVQHTTNLKSLTEQISAITQHLQKRIINIKWSPVQQSLSPSHDEDSFTWNKMKSKHNEIVESAAALKATPASLSDSDSNSSAHTDGSGSDTVDTQETSSGSDATGGGAAVAASAGLKKKKLRKARRQAASQQASAGVTVNNARPHFKHNGKVVQCIRVSEWKKRRDVGDTELNLFARAMEKIISGRRPGKNLKKFQGYHGVFGRHLNEVYLTGNKSGSKSGWRILYEPGGGSKLDPVAIIWDVCDNHKHVERVAKLIANNDKAIADVQRQIQEMAARASKEEAKAGAGAATPSLVLDEYHNWGGGIIPMYELPADFDWSTALDERTRKLFLRLTKEEQKIADIDGFVGIQGRAGTGKTFVLLKRMIRHAQIYAIKHEFDLYTNDQLLHKDQQPAAKGNKGQLPMESKVAVVQAPKAMAVKSRGRGGAIASGATGHMDDDDHIFMQVFLTRSPGLSSEMRDNIPRYVRNHPRAKMLFLPMAVKSLAGPGDSPWGTFYNLFESQLLPEQAAAAAGVRFDTKNRVTFAIFKDAYDRPREGVNGRVLDAQVSRLRGKCPFPASVVWSHIQTYIKGSMEAFRNGRALTFKEYREVTESLVSSGDFTKNGIQEIYNVYKRTFDPSVTKYRNQFGEAMEDVYDNADRVLYLSTRIHGLLRRQQQEGGTADDRAIENLLWRTGRHPIDRIYIDEIQDITPAELMLVRYAVGRRTDVITIAGDTTQTITPGRAFRFEDMKKVMQSSAAGAAVSFKRLKLNVLSKNHRSHMGNVQFAAAIASLLENYYGSEKAPPDTSSTVGPRPSYWQTDKAAFLKELGLRPSAKLLFRNQKSKKAFEAYAKTNGLEGQQLSSSLFTVEEAKGLEFDIVVLVDFFSSSEHELKTNLWRYLADGTTQNIKKDPAMEHELRLMYVAITRCVKHALLVETEPSKGRANNAIKWMRDEGMVKPYSEPRVLSLAQASSEEMINDAVKMINLALTGESINKDLLLKARRILEASVSPTDEIITRLDDTLHCLFTSPEHRFQTEDELIDFTNKCIGCGLYQKAIDTLISYERNLPDVAVTQRGIIHDIIEKITRRSKVNS